MKIAHDLYVQVMEMALILLMADCKHKEIPCAMAVLMSTARRTYGELLDKVQDRPKFTLSTNRGASMSM